MRTIALEEHFWTPGLAAPPGTGPLAVWGPGIGDRLADLARARLTEMDANGIDVQVISHAPPGPQGIAGPAGLTKARDANDQLAAAVRAHPDRFAGLASLPTADVRAAAGELTRAVTGLGFAGGIVHSTFGTDGAFLDNPRFGELLAMFEELDVPMYLHPAAPPAGLRSMLYDGLPGPVAARLATSAWGWHAEAGLHVLRMIAGGVFGRHPGLRVIVGHCGEMLPFMLDRLDSLLPLDGPPVSDIFRRHFWVTTSGMFSVPPVMCAIEVLGVDNVMFSVDYPFGTCAAGRALLDALPLSPPDKTKVAGQTAAGLLRLDA